MSTNREQNTTVSGRCVCGAVRYQARNVRELWYCHCEQCRRMTGHYMAAAQVDWADIEITGSPKWYYLNEKSAHGFCPDCGCQMFWRNNDNNYLSLTGGSMDDASGLSVGGHIFTAEKGKYYKVPEHELKFLRYWDLSPSHKSRQES